MKTPLSPTKTTAFASGAFLGFALPLQTVLAKSAGDSIQTQNIIFLATLFFFLFLPVLIFVVGTQYMSFGWRDIATKSHWAELLKATVRALYWLLGVGLSFALTAALGF